MPQNERTSGVERFSIQRKGSLLCENMTGNFCGRGRNTINYFIRVTTKRLDERGFVLDNKDLHGIAEQVIRNNNQSCEFQAKQIAGLVASKTEHNLREGWNDNAVVSVRVEISAHAQSRATYEWFAPEGE